ncbi:MULTISPECIES: dihydropteroate synthase [Pseudomonas]|uniref:Dihydropteroate synthase n=1 Tax=Pseudomonas quercus TaxID=2722792 RepID=A0ABX0YI00_9PSED|nr:MULTISPECIES: dihydropteroate synthase [Pseudomonas]MBF7144534.1 dihydropteroate synthase [Pseudomonas sp. LY10J]NJP03073.1 dihydropteroate synthase [Pseudomonas quercus]
MSSTLHSTRLPCGNRVLDLSQTHVMGILNVTPDSFSDGGRFNGRDRAIQRAREMVEAGAALIDVGGESTRPGASPVSVQEELDRVCPVVEAIVAELDVIVSVDTSTPEVITQAAQLGMGLVNDVRALRRPDALEAAAGTQAAVCLMHMRGEPGDMQNAPAYTDLVGEVVDFLADRLLACQNVGIDASRVVLDPGFGFAKTHAHNLSLFKALDRLGTLGRPLLVGVSRKSIVGQALGKPIEGRLFGSLALAALAMVKGAKILRVHDVAETLDVVRMIAAVNAAK